ncbi:MAG: hypothetical protein M3O82_05765 [Verrucomicrobiota bacterium]|nr:hypothetical protein [Verrucomicrobiota bacterium]
MTAIDAHGLTTRFNPLGVFLRRWQLDEVHVQSGEVGLQTYHQNPSRRPPSARCTPCSSLAHSLPSA